MVHEYLCLSSEDLLIFFGKSFLILFLFLYYPYLELSFFIYAFSSSQIIQVQNR